MALRLRSFRLRSAEGGGDKLLLPPPLPLIQLPAEARLARTGVPEERPTHLPVRRHLECQAPAKAERPQPEPILVENRLLVETEQSDYEERQVLHRICVYEYNRPEVFQYSGAPDDTLVFDSLFESGNLQRADRVFRARAASRQSPQASQEYELVIHPDVKNGAYRQWFYFEVRNARPGVSYRFSLVNLAKSGALFGSGLQPVVYSERSAELRHQGWLHAGSHVRYGQRAEASTPSPSSEDGSDAISNVLSFQYTFEHEDDCVYFACIQPYTYTDLVEYLDRLEKDPQRAQTFRRTELCQTIAQNSCDMLTITSPGKQGLSQEDRQVIVLSARVHPGEPNSSWMMKGMIDYLTGASAGASVLRRNFVFKVVPMLNPDGVINGNTRVNLAGWDLNRKWASPVEKLFPTVFHLKRQLTSYQSRGRVAIYCDLHGHSINRNIFTYGCYSHKTSGAAGDEPRTQIKRIKGDPRVFPMIVARHSAFFSFANCDFKVQKSKLTTARVVVHHELGVTNSYTLEASFCGPDFGPRKNTQFSTWDLEDMGRSWCQSLLVYFNLVAEVKELEMERERERELMDRTRQQREQQRQAAGVAVASQDVGEDEQLLTMMMDDYEAAISELFAQSQLGESGDGNDSEEDDPNGQKGGSDLSDAEEEPIPPSTESVGAEIDARAIASVAEIEEGEHKRSGKRKEQTQKKKKKKKKRPHSRAAKRSRKSTERRPNQRGSDDAKGKSTRKAAKPKCKATESDPVGKDAESDTAVRPRRKSAGTCASRSRSMHTLPRAEDVCVLPITVDAPRRARRGKDDDDASVPPARVAILADCSPLLLPNVGAPTNAPRRLWTAPAKYQGMDAGGKKERLVRTRSRGRLELPSLTTTKGAVEPKSSGDEDEEEDEEDDGGDDELASDDEASDGDVSVASAQSEPTEAYRLDF